VKRLNVSGIENFFSVTEKLYSGGSPESEDSFKALANLGIKTIVTVDGAKPNLALAHRYGLRYVHAPHGYDGIPQATAARLVKVAKSVDGPIYVHCHHGKHRGPAAVGIICQGVAGWSPESAVNWMRTAGTAQDYEGLYRSVREFRKPTETELAKLPSNFPESAEVSAMVDTMVEIEQRWDRLKQLTGELDTASSAAGEAVLLWEQFREAQRLPDTARLGKEFQAQMNHAEEAANRLRDTLKARPLAHGDLLKSISDVAQSCKTCHQSYRDADGSR
jgi:cytochrome c556/protein tyrosine phosphatase (PTP) superfamily phosphohydrolase (DUF442 family)